jgi:uncharacterized membrane protein/MinD-like ATPase involved in chromosome partitioning or flagellar assembly
LNQQQNLFPVDVDITTSLVTTIAYAQEEKISVILENPNGKKVLKQLKHRKEIADYVTEQRNRKNVKRAKLLEIAAPLEQLKDGLILADTPGVGSLNTEHTVICYSFLPHADAVVFVSDVSAPLSKDELDFIERFYQHCKNFIFVLTKIDQSNDFSEIVENNRTKLSSILKCPCDQISIIPVSSYLKKTYLEFGEEEDLEESNFKVLEQELWQSLAQKRGYILLMRALNQLGEKLFKIQRPIQTEWEAYQVQSQEELAVMEKQFQDARDRCQVLLCDKANWLTQLTDGILDIRKQILDKSLSQKSIQILNSFQKLLDDPRYLENPEQISQLVTAELSSVITELGDDLFEKAQRLQSQIESDSNLNLNPLGFKSPEILIKNPELKIVQDQEKRDVWSKALEVGRRGSFAAIGPSFLWGAISGTLFLTGVGIAPAVAVAVTSAISGYGIRQGFKETLEAEKQRTKQEILAILRPFIEEKILEGRHELDKGITNVERCLRSDLTNKIIQERETAERALKSIQEAYNATQVQTVKKTTELKQPLEKLNHLISKVEALANSFISEYE